MPAESEAVTTAREKLEDAYGGDSSTYEKLISPGFVRDALRLYVFENERELENIGTREAGEALVAHLARLHILYSKAIRYSERQTREVQERARQVVDEAHRMLEECHEEGGEIDHVLTQLHQWLKIQGQERPINVDHICTLNSDVQRLTEQIEDRLENLDDHTKYAPDSDVVEHYTSALEEIGEQEGHRPATYVRDLILIGLSVGPVLEEEVLTDKGDYWCYRVLAQSVSRALENLGKKESAKKIKPTL